MCSLALFSSFSSQLEHFYRSNIVLIFDLARYLCAAFLNKIIKYSKYEQNIFHGRIDLGRSDFT